MSTPAPVPDAAAGEGPARPDPPTGDRRPRVLHLTQPVDGGVARVVTDLVRAQVAEGLDVTAVCPDSAFALHLRALGAQVRDWRSTRSPGPSLVREVRHLARVIDEVRPDLVHAHSAKAGLAGRLAVRGRIPTVFQPHAWSFEAVGGVTAALALGWERWGARWATRVVCVSEAERATGVRAGITGRWAVVPNGIDPERFRPAHADTVRAGLAPLSALRPATPLVVCVGRLCRQKGQDVLLRAWDTVVRRVPAARLVLVGDGPDDGLLRARAPGSVLFAGAVTDASPWYRAADLVVLPSRWEGMALAPLEAMACGRPVVVTDVDGARESLPPALAPHCLVPPEDPKALAGALSGLLLDPPLRESLGDVGRRHVLSVHDVRHTAEQIAGVYRDLLGARPSGGRGRPSRAVERGGARGTGRGQPPDAGRRTEAANRTTQRVEPTKYRETIRS
ncbi:glycosyltransferase [Streptomyces prasinopilosus]|uniref:glycosyltransferase n=1 Tax=Streptomyces prasinopilosus TaxID=67344 RepID=UPI00099E1C2B|nr:glycosyltransferase [Streptomyces prasinopilosus]